MKISELIKKAKEFNSIYITGHVNPDGDCIGATLALALLFKNAGIKAKVYLTEIVDTYSYIGADDFITTEAPKETDLLILLDVSGFDRIGKIGKLAESAYAVIIDHHINDNPKGNENYIDPGMSSACEFLYSMIDDFSLVDKQVATALCTGMVYDTAAFKHSNTKKSTLMACANLLDYGVDLEYVVNKVMYEKPFLSFKAESIAFERLYLTLNEQIAVTYLLFEDFKKYKLKKEHTERIVGYISDIKGIKGAIFLYPVSRDMYKVSLRSKGYVNMSEVAAVFGGGGHKNASGASIVGNLDKCIEDVLDEIRMQLN